MPRRSPGCCRNRVVPYVRVATIRGRGVSRSNTPRRVVVPPMSPASTFAIDNRIILLHLDAVPPGVGHPSGGCLPVVSTHSPNPQPLAGQLVVFTGKLSSLGRKDAFALVAQLGGATADDVNAKTTMLVDRRRGIRADRPGSQKLKKAEELNAEQPGEASTVRRFVSEDEFCGSPACSRRGIEEAVSGDARSARALPRAARRSRPVSRQVRHRAARRCGPTRTRTSRSPTSRRSSRPTTIWAQGLSFRSIVRDADGVARTASCAFDFRHEATPAKIITLRRPRAEPATSPPSSRTRRRRSSATRRWPRGTSAKAPRSTTATSRRWRRRPTAYRKALEHDPYLVAALINLANIHYSRDELAEAQALYERAIGLESDFFEAHFNLGNIYHDLNRFAEAQACYREALRLNPYYADAHFYLAVTFEKMGHVAGRAAALEVVPAARSAGRVGRARQRILGIGSRSPRTVAAIRRAGVRALRHPHSVVVACERVDRGPRLCVRPQVAASAARVELSTYFRPVRIARAREHRRKLNAGEHGRVGSSWEIKALYKTQRWSIVLAFVVAISSVAGFTAGGQMPLPLVLLPLSGVDVGTSVRGDGNSSRHCTRFELREPGTSSTPGTSGTLEPLSSGSRSGRASSASCAACRTRSRGTRLRGRSRSCRPSAARRDGRSTPDRLQADVASGTT